MSTRCCPRWLLHPWVKLRPGERYLVFGLVYVCVQGMSTRCYTSGSRIAGAVVGCVFVIYAQTLMTYICPGARVHSRSRTLVLFACASLHAPCYLTLIYVSEVLKMVRKYAKKARSYNDHTLKLALEEIASGVSIKEASRKLNIGYGKLWSEYKKRRESEDYQPTTHAGKRGRKGALSDEIEAEILRCVKIMEKMGMPPPIAEFQSLVHDYLECNQCVTPFKDNRPGRDWVSSFLKRHGLTLKKGGMMQLARKSVTSDPFVVYGFYDKLGKVIDKLGLADKPSSIFNMDETGFPTDPSKTKTIGTKGVKTVRIAHGANRENISVLATCCADGTALPPLIVFKGKKMQTTWRGDDALPGTQYAVTDSGWMTTSVFADFFESFVEEVKGRGPILVVLDGHLSHTSLQTVDLAVKNNITILKLPPHCTDLLQPLDVACFAPLKSYYDSKLLEYTQSTGGRENLRKDLFVNMLCSVWNTGLSKNNIVAGFRATGIHPLDRTKYNTSRLDTVKLKTYDDWVSAGKPTDDDDQPILPTARTQTLEIPPPPAPEDETTAAYTPVSTSKRLVTASTSTDYQTPGCSFWQSPVSKETAALHELKKYTDQQLVDELLSRDEAALSLFFKCLSSSISQNAKNLPSIEAVLHCRGRGATPLTKKRRVIPMTSSVITDEMCRKKITEMNKPKTRPRKKGASTQTEKSRTGEPKKKTKGKKRKLKGEDEDSDSTVVSSVAMTESKTSSDISLEDLLRDDLEEML